MNRLELPVAILAGGLATRLRPLTETIPKSLLEIHGEPFIAHQLHLLRANGIQRAVLCVGYLGDSIRDRVGNGDRFDMQIQYCFDGPVLMGTAGAIKRALPFLADSFFVLYGDSYLPCNYQRVAEAFHGSGKQGLMTVFHNQGRWDRSNVEYAGGRIWAYDKQRVTPKMCHIDYGLGVFKRSAFSRVPDVPSDLAALYRQLLEAQELATLEVEERFYEIGSVEGLHETAEYLQKHSPSTHGHPAA
jgi:NDP-sugar pyrophosphorylase family protein